MGGVNALLVSTLAISTPAHALSLSALSFTGNGITSNSDSLTLGYAFNVLDPNGIIVTDLSIYDGNSDGLNTPHNIGLWDSAGTLLASANVSFGTVNPLSANGLFRTVAITNILLPQASNYVVGAVFFPSSDPQAFNLTGLTTPSEISFVEGRFIDNGGSSLTFPTSSNTGIIGGSFEFVPATPVPFEFNPVMGLSVLSGLWAGKRLIKKVKAGKKSD